MNHIFVLPFSHEISYNVRKEISMIDVTLFSITLYAFFKFEIGIMDGFA